ncbi:hypothetical protein [Sphingobium sp. UBA5915]|uniref:hypothetical protein n=1 Tax=Sphingobium sp. UBA5915 TaxID=1947530 RepID=UPI0025DEBC4E|nr:hypothetical protein [Sphingobium sp. UBA5915]
MTMYLSSKGAVPIATMPFPYATNALKKLNRESPERIEEIKALTEHIAKLEAEGSGNSRAVVGDNQPPEEPAVKVSGREAIDVHVSDLLTEVANWADGVAIETEGQAAEVGKLHRSLQQAAELVKDNAATEKKPHNDAITEIQSWNNGYVAKGLKGTPDGSLTKAIAATGRLSTAWLTKQEEERKAREKAAADAALIAAKEAFALREEAKETTDLAVMDRAEDALAGAKALLREADGVAKEKVKVSAGQGVRAVGLRSIWHADLVDAPNSWALAYGHYKQNPAFMDEFHALIQRWADRDARIEAHRLAGVPGFHFREEKVAA